MKAITVSSFHHPIAYHHVSFTEIVGVFFEGQIGKNSNFEHRSGKWKIFNFKCGMRVKRFDDKKALTLLKKW